MNDNDLVFHKNKDGNIISGGYLIKSSLTTLPMTTVPGSLDMDADMDTGVPVATLEDKPQSKTKAKSSQKGGAKTALVSDIFKNLAVPAGLFYMQQTLHPKPITDALKLIEKTRNADDANVIDDSLYDKLVDMVSLNKKKTHNRHTRSKRKRQAIKMKQQSGTMNKNKKTKRRR